MGWKQVFLLERDRLTSATSHDIATQAVATRRTLCRRSSSSRTMEGSRWVGAKLTAIGEIEFWFLGYAEPTIRDV